MFLGERYDYILRADQAIGNYWLKLKAATGRCGDGYAIVRYAGAPETDPEEDQTAERDGIVSTKISRKKPQSATGDQFKIPSQITKKSFQEMVVEMKNS